jgi:uncharacterized protein
VSGRQAIAYVVVVDGANVTLNLSDLHRGQLAAHGEGIAVVTEVGSLLGLQAGGRLLVMKVLSLSFAEPREAHRFGSPGATHAGEPLRNINGVIVGQLIRNDGALKFINDSLMTPPLGSEAYPLSPGESDAIMGRNETRAAPVILGHDLRGGGPLVVGLESLVSRHVAVLGSSGQGKSCLTAAVMQQVAKLPRARIVILDINGEYEQAFPTDAYEPGEVKVTRLGGSEADAFRIPYYALGRLGLQRLLLPSDKTQRPALSFALDHLHQVKWHAADGGVALSNQPRATMFDDCRQDGADVAKASIDALRSTKVASAGAWPPMRALAALIAESHGLGTNSRGATERNGFNYGNVSPLITRIWRHIDDELFRDVVDVNGGAGIGSELDWKGEAAGLVDRIFGGSQVPWKVHIVDLRRLSHDLAPFILGALLELFAYQLFRRGQAQRRDTLLVLEEAHHYLRPHGTGEDASNHSLAYERLAKEGRKFGLALWLSTQRPSEISPTVLAQCNNWLAFRLTSERDLAAVQSASEWADRSEVKRIAGLPRQHTMVFGGSFPMASLVRAATAAPTPSSSDGRFDDWSEPLPPH